MAYNSTTDNLLSNIVTNTSTLDQGDFPSLCGMIIESTGLTFVIKTPQQFAAAGASVYTGANGVSMKEIVGFLLVGVTDGKFSTNIDDALLTLITTTATDYLSITGGSRAFFIIKKVEVEYLMTAAVVPPANSSARYKLTAEVYNQ
jgi:hypothetical protein